MKKTRRTPVHPIFEECSKLSEDQFWKDVLLSCSYNKFPNGFMYKEGFLTHRRGKKISRISLSADPTLALVETLNFFKEKDSLASEKDRLAEEAAIDEQSRFLEDISSWAVLKKKKKLLEIVINEYIRRVIRELNLGQYEKDQLTTVINLAMLQGYLSEETVTLRENKIVAIKDLTWLPQEKLFLLPEIEEKSKAASTKRSATSRKAPNSHRSNGKQTVNFYSLWLEFLKTYKESKN